MWTSGSQKSLVHLTSAAKSLAKTLPNLHLLYKIVSLLLFKAVYVSVSVIPVSKTAVEGDISVMGTCPPAGVTGLAQGSSLRFLHLDVSGTYNAIKKKYIEEIHENSFCSVGTHILNLGCKLSKSC